MEKRSFEELYNEILNEYKDTYRKKQIESLKSSIKETYNKYPIDFLVIMCLGIIFSIALKKFLILYFFAFYLLIYFLFLTHYRNSKFNILFKNEIIGKMIKNLDDRFSYDFKSGFTSDDVLAIDSTLKHDIFYSEDLITGDFDNNLSLKSSEIILKDRDGRDVIIVFIGTLSQVKMPVSVSDEVTLQYSYEDNSLELESNDFSDTYTLSSENRLLAAKLFTPEVINKINTIINYKIVDFINIIIKDNTINFFYIFPGSYLEKNVLFPLNKTSLEQIYNELKLNIEATNEISQMILNNMNN